VELFTGFITKPKIDEKYFKKPPPKYIYELVISTMNVTGFPKGIFNENDLNPKYFDEVHLLL
jgi:hypothetical protein